MAKSRQYSFQLLKSAKICKDLPDVPLVSVTLETVTVPYVLAGKMLLASVVKILARLVAAAELAAVSDDEK